MKRTFSSNLLLACLLLVASLAHGAQDSIQGLDPIYTEFILAEMANSYQAKDSTVDPRYRGQTLEPFKVGYLEIPAERLHLETSSVNSRILQEHFYVPQTNQQKIRFYIHPDSEHLYQPLIKEFGFKGFYWALPTASTRSVLAWDPNRPHIEPLFLKLSLAQIQDRMSRIIPGWEVRRSVRLTNLIDSDLRSGRVKGGNVSLIPEVSGAYVKSEEGLAYYVDRDQGKVSEHGYIMRDASFIKKHQGKRIVPMFWLFSQVNGGEPPIIQMWKKSESYRLLPGQPKESFARFLFQDFFQPFVRMNLPLMVKQGIVPQIHGQNVVLILNEQNGKIEAIYHRDIGSMKTDYRLRWIEGLPIDALRSPMADKDFGLSWGMEKIRDYHLDYLHDWLLRWAYLPILKKYVNGFDPLETRPLMENLISKEVSHLLGALTVSTSATEKLSSYIDQSAGRIFERLHEQDLKAEAISDIHLRTYLVEREAKQQAVKLPDGWGKLLKEKLPASISGRGYLFTDYGVVYFGQYLKPKDRSVKIAFYAEKSDESRLSRRLQRDFKIRVCRKVHAG